VVLDVRLLAAGEIVNDRHLASGSHDTVNQMAADESGPACDQDVLP
jgi:hypothetical protein